MGSLLAELARWVFDVVHSFGYVGVFVVVLLGSLYLPVPTELTLPLFGFLVGQGRLTFVPVVLTATAARVGARWSSTRWGSGSARRDCGA
jgi:membrane protein DedA with SNARE-associated domain